MDNKLFLDSLLFEYVNASDVKRAFQLEFEGYPPEEAATLEKLEYRQSLAPTLFLGAYLPPNLSTSSERLLIGFVVSTLTSATTITEESMSHHDPFGKTVCVHSVCVDKLYQRRGVAARMLNEYITKLRNESQNRDTDVKYERAVLISHEYLIPLYQKVGFILKGESQVVHGNDKWFDLTFEF
ncbi:22222_t:CDS:2 [Cetraspora pellucida]|uniref:22222_t:CDS:1 n=1 Tax=Cetraspora pellucida TaxID=1433469 RepID=A0A9N8VM08_9GLOM|nr:22222_t:CDS:2 [Cetraspora pellucida]